MARKSTGSTSYSVMPDMKEIQSKLARLAQSAQREALERALMAGAQIVKDAANAKAPGPNVDYSVDPRKLDTLASVSVGPDKAHWYYQFAETGTARHEIGPKRKGQLKAIRFNGSEGDVIVAVIEHPGTAARPFLRPAIVENEQRVVDAVGAEIKRAIVEVEA